MTTFEDFWPSVEPIVAQVGIEYERRYRVYGADREDFKQELIAWLLENEAEVANWWHEMEPRPFEQWLAGTLRNEAGDFGLDIKAQALGYDRNDLYFYGKNELKALLPDIFDKRKWLEPPQSEGRSNKSQAEGNNWACTLSDVSRAYEALDKGDRDILAAVHRDEYNSKLISEMFSISESTANYRYNKALDRLQGELGGPKPDPMREQQSKQDVWRGRKPISNARAQAMTGADYE